MELVHEFCTVKSMYDWVDDPKELVELQKRYPPDQYNAYLDLQNRQIFIMKKGN